MSADLSHQLELVAEQASRDFDDALLRSLTQLLGSAEAADQAMAEAACVLEGGTLAWRLDPHTLMAELFCDVGLPEAAFAEDAYRLALRANLNRDYPGVYIGAHADSDRLVATSAVPAVLMANDDYCVTALANLAAHARHLREQVAPYLAVASPRAQA